MLRQITVRNAEQVEIRPRRLGAGRVYVKVVRRGDQDVMLRSTDGVSWFMRPDSMLAFQRRKIEITPLTAREKQWIDVLDDGPPDFIIQTGAAVRFHFASMRGDA